MPAIIPIVVQRYLRQHIRLCEFALLTKACNLAIPLVRPSPSVLGLAIYPGQNVPKYGMMWCRGQCPLNYLDRPWPPLDGITASDRQPVVPFRIAQLTLCQSTRSFTSTSIPTITLGGPRAFFLTSSGCWSSSGESQPSPALQRSGSSPHMEMGLMQTVSTSEYT